VVTTSPSPRSAQLDPNLIIDHHLTAFCPALNPLTAKSVRLHKSIICGASKCSLKLISPIACERKCGKQLCAAHRNPIDHACTVKKESAPSNGAALPIVRGVRASAIGKWAVDMVQSASAHGSDHSSTSAPKAKPKNPFLLSDLDDNLPSRTSTPPLVVTETKKSALASIPTKIKISKHANAERKSARMAMEVRAKRGLLSEREKLEYATLVALEQEDSNNKKDCCIS